MSLLKPLRRRSGLSVLLLALLAALGQSAEPAKPANPEPTRQELWVPSEHLDQVLKKYPNAVLLSPEQYEALIRDAGKTKPKDDPKDKPPVDLCIERLTLKGSLDPKASSLRLKGTLTLFSTTKEWSQLNLQWYLPLISADAEGTLFASLSKDGGLRYGSSAGLQTPRTLTVHTKGTGRHLMNFETEVPVVRSSRSGMSSLTVFGERLRGYLDLTVPAGFQLLDSTSYARLPDGTLRLVLERAGVMLASASPKSGPNAPTMPMVVRAYWSSADASAPVEPPQISSHPWFTASINESEVFTRMGFRLTGLGKAAGGEHKIQIKLTPGAQVTALKPNTKRGLLDWRQEGDVLHLTTAVVGANIELEASLRLPREAADTEVSLPHIILPQPAFVQVKLTLSEGLELLSSTPQFTAPLNDLPKLSVRAAKPRLEVNADLVAKLEKDSVSLTRTLDLRTDRPVYELRLSLPEGEEFVRIENAMKDFEWKRVTRNLELRFPTGVTATAPQKITLITRQKLLKAWSGPRQPELVKIVPLAIPEAVNVSGYNALAFDDAWRVALKTTTGLEDRDAQLSPVSGRMAWFSLRDWELGFEVERAEPVFSAEITAYALPRARTVEIEGQVRLEISAAPLRSFQLRLPAATAKLLRMTSPVIGQQTLDEATGLWTYTLRQESTGTLDLRFRLSLPAQVAASAEQTLKASLPVLELPAARRFAGTWVIEANTDTQVSFEAQSLQPLDVLRAPVINSYQPRHRLIAAYTYGVGAHTLELTAKRHAHSELATLVVRRLLLTTVLSPDGARRHEAIFHIHHTGEQFMPVKLPAKARLLSLEVEHLGVKPVNGEKGMIAIPLPAGSHAARISVIYEESGTPWTSSGEEQIQPPEFLAGLPVLETEWHVHAPNGRHYELGGQFTDKVQSDHVPDLLSRISPWSSAVSRSPGLTESEADRLRRELFEAHETEKAMAVVNEQTKRRLQAGVIPQMQFSEVPLTYAVEFLRQQWKLAEAREDSSLPKLSFVVTPEAAQSTVNITLDLKDVPFPEALRYITELAGLKYRVKANAVVIVPVSLFADEIQTRVFKVTSGALEKLDVITAPYAPALDPFGLPQVQMTPAISRLPKGSNDWWVQLLKDQGIPFPDGSGAFFDADRGEVIVRNSQPNLDLVESFFASVTDPAVSALLYSEDDSVMPGGGARYSSANSYLEKKLHTIIFPQVQFSNASIEEAVEFLTVKSRDLDTETDPIRRGIGIILKAGEEGSSARISLDLKDVPLFEALRYVTELAGMKFKVEPYAVLIVPVTETTTEQYTRIYKVPKEWMLEGYGSVFNPTPGAPDPFAEDKAAFKKAGMLQRTNSLDILKSSGIPFPEGGTAVYNAVTGQLIVKNTQPNLDLVENFVDHIYKEAEARGFTGSTKAGLLPLDLDLPTAGQMLKLSGHQAPEVLTLSYVSWGRQLAFAMLAVLAGMGAFVRWAWRRPWRTSFLVIALLVLGAPMGLGGPDLALANAFLFGWLLALALWCLWTLVEKISRLGADVNGEEAAV